MHDIVISKVASIGMACLDTPRVLGFEVNWNLKQNSTASSSSSFSNVAAKEDNTQSGPTKDKH